MEWEDRALRRAEGLALRAEKFGVSPEIMY